MENDIQMVVLEAGKDLPIKLSFGFDAGGFEKPGKQFIYSFNWQHEPNFNTYKIIQLEYWDVLGNIYNQSVKLIAGEFSITPPYLNLRYELEYLSSKKLINKLKSIFKKKKAVTSLFPSEDKNSNGHIHNV